MLRVADLVPESAARAPVESRVLRVAAGPRGPRHFLFVTAPFGPFSSLLARRLRNGGARCTRVLLNGGDVIDWGLARAAAYSGPREGWGAWVGDYMEREAVTDLIVFGDCHPYCAGAIDEARGRGVAVHVLEEGYFRPHWITLEREGVNGCSRLPRDPQAYRWAPGPRAPATAAALGPAHAALTLRISLYFVGVYAALPIFRRFRQPYAYSPLRQALAHTRKFVGSRLLALGRHRRRAPRPDRYFLVLLQRPGDSQIVRHSPFRSVGDMIDLVMASFACCAPADARLVFKTHPLDHGIERHDRRIERVSAALGVEGRVTLIDDARLEDVLGAAQGVVTVNSTGGLAALELGKPTIALGQAIYSLPGLAHQSGLDRFWAAPETPDPSLFEAFKHTVIALTQVNGAFASRAGARLAAEGVAERLLTG